VTRCGHESTLNVDLLPDDLPVPDVSLRLRCPKCGSRSIYTPPNWTELRAAGMGQDA
jgi:DNA-directed RNA polymerase subunit RPC12/RpoP